MSKELFVTSTPHETKLAIVEDDQLVEVYFERENEYTLAGSIYKGKVTRVLPGMQSAFVEVGLERDAFLYVTDFLEEVEDSEEFETVSPPSPRRGDHQRTDRSAQRDRSFSPPQQSSPEMQIEGDFTGEGESAGDDEASGNQAQQNEALSSAVPEGNSPGVAGADEQSERGPRRWRGRRGRRRGRPAESKNTQADEQSENGNDKSEAEEGVQSDIQDSSPNYLAHVEQRTEQNTTDVTRPHSPASDETSLEVPRSSQELSPATPAPSEGKRRNQREERPARNSRPERIVLPGESLAKFNRKPEEEQAVASQSPAAQVSESRFQVAPRRPSTEVTQPASLLSASHGILAGESLAKYRQVKPAIATAAAVPQRGAESAENDRERDEHAEEAADSHNRQNAGLAEPSVDVFHETSTERDADRDQGLTGVQEQPQPQEAALSQTTEQQPGEYNFRPGTGIVEEEEVSEEEHDPTAIADGSEDEEYEELEEETLDSESPEHREEKIIAAGEGLASVFAQEKVQSTQYMAEEVASEEDELEEEPIAGAHDAALQAYPAAEVDGEDEQSNHGMEDPSEVEVDVDDPNYAGSAELRAPASTAGYQVKTERTGFDPRRGNRKGRGRPPMRRGGPRRNIPRGPMPQIDELLKEGQEILVQIAKEPMAKKGARITSHIALPGRFLVFMPTVNHTGVSRKIGSEEERQRLKRILLSEKGQGHGGFIVRTAASGASEDDLRADIRFLINLWNEIKQRSETSKAPALIYHDLNLVERILRDQVTSTFSHIWVDNEVEYERIVRFTSRFQPSLVKRVKLYTKDTPLFEQFNIQEEINKALKSKVWLKSGGYIVINQTEALVAIDINTGKYVGKTARLEDTIVKTNIDAIKEIVRQIRLRDLGGIIVIDFIDMDERKNRQKVMQALEEALKSDRSPSKVLQFNDFGLVAITRKRVKQSLERTLGTQCVYCTGTGMIKSVVTVCNEMYVELRKMAKHFENQQVILRVNPEVAKAMKDNGGKWLTEMEEMLKRTIIVKSDPAQHQEQFDIN